MASSLFALFQADFVLHGTQFNSPLFSVPCGGGHRSYSLTAISQVIQIATDLLVVLVCGNSIILA